MKTFPKELVEEVAHIIETVYHPIEQSEAVEEALFNYGYDADDIVDLMNYMTPTAHA